MYKKCIVCVGILIFSSFAAAQQTFNKNVQINGVLYTNAGGERKAAHFRTNNSEGPYIQIGNDTYVHELQGQGILSSGKLRIAGKTINITTQGTTSRMHFNQEGNVGIGTTNPKAKLHIGGSNPKIVFGEQNGYQYGRYAIDMWDQKLKVTVPGNGTLMEFFGDSANNRFINVGANLGIGTTTPGARLHVRTESNATYLFLDNPSRNWGISSHTGNFYISDKTGNKDFFAIKNNGNVAIGTNINLNGVQDRLFVDGSVKIRGNTSIDGTITTKKVVVTLDGWSDFVFDEDYKLIPLDQVEEMIKKQHHLPDIPSEKEVMDQGVSVGEMQSKLLQKIEELTLYTIQQNKQIKALEKEFR